MRGNPVPPVFFSVLDALSHAGLPLCSPLCDLPGGLERRVYETLTPGCAPARLISMSLLLFLRTQQRLDRAPLVHRAVALGDLVKRQGQVKDLARVDLSVPHQIDQLR